MVAAGSLLNTRNQASRGAGLTISKEMLTLLDAPLSHLCGLLEASCSERAPPASRADHGGAPWKGRLSDRASLMRLEPIAPFSGPRRSPPSLARTAANLLRYTGDGILQST
jgi:hypothetical protein